MSKKRPTPNRLLELRASKNWTQEDVSVRTGYSQPTIQRHESGQRDLDGAAIDRYAMAYGVKPHQIFIEG
jgi:transcriptional regulator with XRE-family HTH domain